MLRVRVVMADTGPTDGSRDELRDEMGLEPSEAVSSGIDDSLGPRDLEARNSCPPKTSDLDGRPTLGCTCPKRLILSCSNCVYSLLKSVRATEAGWRRPLISH